MSRNAAASRAFLLQVLILALVIALAGFLAFNLIGNLGARSIRTGFAFLHGTAGFDIGESFLPYDAHATYGRALLVGLLNTLAVSAAGILLSSVIGTVVGPDAFRKAADFALAGAKPYEHNAFKVELAKQSIVRALTLTAQGVQA